MTTSLSSDVPVGYFSWAEYDIMAPVQPKTENALAAAFISNCGARNFRLQALEGLEKANIKIDSYGGCHRNRDGSGAHFKYFWPFLDITFGLIYFPLIGKPKFRLFSFRRQILSIISFTWWPIIWYWSCFYSFYLGKYKSSCAIWCVNSSWCINS